MGSVIDLTFISDTLSKDLQWQERRKGAERIKRAAVAGWTSKKLDKEMFEEILLQEAMPMGTAEEKVMQVLEKTQKACEASMPRRTVLKKRMPNFWWDAEIDDLRKVCLKARSLVVR